MCPSARLSVCLLGAPWGVSPARPRPRTGEGSVWGQAASVLIRRLHATWRSAAAPAPSRGLSLSPEPWCRWGAERPPAAGLAHGLETLSTAHLLNTWCVFSPQSVPPTKGKAEERRPIQVPAAACGCRSTWLAPASLAPAGRVQTEDEDVAGAGAGD